MSVNKLSTLFIEIVGNKSLVQLWTFGQLKRQTHTITPYVCEVLFHQCFQVTPHFPLWHYGSLLFLWRDTGILSGQQNPGICNFHRLIQSRASKLDMRKIKKKLIFCWWPGICKWWLNYGGLVPSQLITLKSSLNNMFRRKLVRLTMFTMPSVMH